MVTYFKELLPNGDSGDGMCATKQLTNHDEDMKISQVLGSSNTEKITD